MSVYRTSDIIEEEIWNIGKNVAVSRSKTLKGRVDIAVSNVKANRLDVVPDDAPSIHANIVDWPARKEERMEIAMKLADASSGHRKE